MRAREAEGARTPRGPVEGEAHARAVDALEAMLEAAGPRAIPAVAATLGSERMAQLVREVAAHVGPGATRLLAHVVASRGGDDDLAARLSDTHPTASPAHPGEIA